MAGTFRLEVITPERCLLDREVAAVILPAEGGAIGILPGHAALVATLEAGPARITLPDGRTLLLALGAGFVEVGKGQVRVLADAGEEEDAIDLERARRAEERARARLRERAPDLDLARAEAALARALVRQRIARDLKLRREPRRVS
jgi:F-type H+-transporting ATPase subunit epsilon